MRVLLIAATAALLAGAATETKAFTAPAGGGLTDAAESMDFVEKTQVFVRAGRRYCFYVDAWNGPGWYRCGYAFRRGLGFGGAYGWNGWYVPRYHSRFARGDFRNHRGDHRSRRDFRQEQRSERRTIRQEQGRERRNMREDGGDRQERRQNGRIDRAIEQQQNGRSLQRDRSQASEPRGATQDRGGSMQRGSGGQEGGARAGGRQGGGTQGGGGQGRGGQNGGGGKN
jgi:hypothetical protein